MAHRNSNRPSDPADLDLRPRAVLAVGITGHRNTDASFARSVQIAVSDLLQKLSLAFEKVAEGDAPYFSAEKPVLRFVTMAADGADLAGALAARESGFELACVLPFETNEYLNDFSEASIVFARETISAANARLELPGTRAEGPRAYERANEVILANVDVLIAVWDGERASGRAGTGDVVQSAVSSNIPIIVINPKEMMAIQLLVHGGYDEIELPVATDMKRSALPSDLTQFVDQIVSPPAESAGRLGLESLFAERARSYAWRIEYSLLLKIFGASGVRRNLSDTSDSSRSSLINADIQPKSLYDLLLAPDSVLQQHMTRIDQLANYYSQLARSSATSGYLVIIIVALVSALVGVIFPSISDASIVIQMVVNGLILVDAAFRRRRRWVERWLDYRSVAEKLRSLRFLHPLGLGDLRRPISRYRKSHSWVDWYIRRSERALGAPSAPIRNSDVPNILRYLIHYEIEHQLGYHRHTFRQLGILERRLSLAANVSLASTILIALMLFAAAYYVGGMQYVGWKPLALVALAVFPAAMTAFNGIRADADLVHLVERSALTLVALARLKQSINPDSLNYDHAAIAATRAGSLMSDELSEWRLMLENRRVRRTRH